MEPPQIKVNGQALAADSAGPHTNLLTWLRDQGLTGAKEGCAEGECGACAVMVARADAARPDGVGEPIIDGGTSEARAAGRTRWTAINACLVPALAFDGQEIITAEGLGAPATPGREANLHPVQREMADRGGSQCGYCTPGFICSMAAEYYRPGCTPARAATGAASAGTDGADPREGDADPGESGAALGEGDATPASDSTPARQGHNGFDLHALSGNLCRCTGYRPIRDAAYALGEPAPQDPLVNRQREPAPPLRRTRVRHNGAQFIRPGNLAEFLDLYAAEPEAVLLAGATDLGVDINLRHLRPPLVLAVDHLPEMRVFDTTDHHIEIGGALTLSELERALAGRVRLLAELFPQFASPLIRNTATLGGNIATASPIGDAAPVLLALGASLRLTSARGEREIPLDEYFTGYRQTVREPGEVIRAIRIPLPIAPTSAFYKVAKRRFDDISSVAVAIAMTLDSPGRDDEGRRTAARDGHTHEGQANDDAARPAPPRDAVTGKAHDGAQVTQVRIGLGGVAATPIRATATETALIGKPWTEATAHQAAATMATEGTPLDDHRASARYRSAMLEQAMLRFFAETGGE